MNLFFVDLRFNVLLSMLDSIVKQIININVTKLLYE